MSVLFIVNEKKIYFKIENSEVKIKNKIYHKKYNMYRHLFTS